MQITSLQATDQGGDVLLVRATVDTLEGVFEARGWVSATTNHYDAADYGADGNRQAKAKARTMTDDERLAYCARLLAEQNAELAGLASAPEQPAAPAVLVEVNPDVLEAAVAAQDRAAAEQPA